ncbi:flagellar hook-basal body complex protein FliE [Thermoclostridium stercorarium subsp. stercorarium DSM 8532]|jgi:flagellar hook-basal body complex protein FliE|uniref:Flagellar hook-basal body complex protein FliE n=3 Tax=Thermoclostridium stercorarium TaxID=1510 RepID=L7VPS4_THES1|nr:flagellar hook-basal body complex protein FliE [Thermoclostridium stercorarium]AGC67583.1 flagellar hook-basal body complex protein FliE [Thermoclostridium stercorarium subsp. stercorarium DSM 8532]AGI38632.1 FliE [Thermoclostridium stercorarium subsp. stercorarium DSM 8532]ANW98005.1 flagellar hook-basal body protein FliE [Thermoclostridium stercorarium subsp. thermolacticum DSM 2910]ANX00554.1 flagellar hook-basal body protein FliE [Thermoclostridium stercorarium subsp. leptospartum DSM 92
MNVSAVSSVMDNMSVNNALNKVAEKESISFRDMLMNEIYRVSELEKEADAITSDFISGKTDNIHSVLIAAEKASIALQLMIEIRNKVIDAYNEIMRMQV